MQTVTEQSAISMHAEIKAELERIAKKYNMALASKRTVTWTPSGINFKYSMELVDGAQDKPSYVPTSREKATLEAHAKTIGLNLAKPIVINGDSYMVVGINNRKKMPFILHHVTNKTLHTATDLMIIKATHKQKEDA